MRTSKFSETQIVAILKEADAGAKVKDICRKHGIFLDAGEFRDFKSESLMDLFRGLIKGRR